MLRCRTLSTSLLFLTLLTSARSQTQLHFPRPTGWVNDFANVIDGKTNRRLSNLCAEVDHKTNAQIAVVTIDSLEGTPVGDYARLLFNDWGIGHKEDNRGMLILLSVTDRTYFISVGRGFESLFPTDRVAAIGRRMIPDLKQQNYSQAVLHATREIADIIARERKVELRAARDPSLDGTPGAFRSCGHATTIP